MRKVLKSYFDKIRNEKIRILILQAFPFWIASLVTGLIAVGYTRLFGMAEKGLELLSHAHHWLIFLVTPVCFLTASTLVKRLAPYASGSGIPQVMAATEFATPKQISLADKLLNIRIIVVKIASSCLMALGGGIIGREGPTIQIAGSVFRKINAWLPDWWPSISRRNMIMTGAAAGLAAAFNTPLGGIVFAMEELTKTHIRFFKTAIFSAVIIAGLTAQSMLGPYLYIGYPELHGWPFWIFLPVLLCSIVCGVTAAVMCKGMLRLIRWKSRLQRNWHTTAYVLACGVLVAGIAFCFGDSAIHSGKETITGILFTNDKYLPWYTPVARIVGSVFSFTTGASGGVFAPALSSGATIGSVLSHLFTLSPAAANLLVLSGMVAFLTGVTRSPFTSAILVLEMTDGHSIIFILMLAALAANLSAYFIDKHSFYDHIKMSYIKTLRTQE